MEVVLIVLFWEPIHILAHGPYELRDFTISLKPPHQQGTYIGVKDMDAPFSQHVNEDDALPTSCKG
jgi:hypothetical protein